MREVYRASDPLHATVIKDFLETQGIPSIVQGEFMYAVMGETFLSHPSVWVLRDADFDRARDLIAEFERQTKQKDAQTWQCGNCGEVLEAQFSECWRCGTSRSSKP